MVLRKASRSFASEAASPTLRGTVAPQKISITRVITVPGRNILEFGINIKLDDVVLESRPINAVRAQPAQSKPDVRGQGEASADGISFQVRAAQAKIGVIESINDGI